MTCLCSKLMISALILLMISISPTLVAVFTGGEALQTMLMVHAQRAEQTTPTVRTFTVTVTHNGFNGKADPLTLEVSQGDIVELTFVYGDTDLAYDNHHEIEIVGLTTSVVEVSKANPKATIRFDVNQAGTFEFMCIVFCDGHEKLQNGKILVKPTGETVTGPLKETHLTMLDPLPVGTGVPFSLEVALSDQSGNPVEGALVRFVTNSTFGAVILGQNLTDSKGIAKLVFVSYRAGTFRIEAQFQGGAGYGPSVNTTTLTIEESNPAMLQELMGAERVGVAQPAISTILQGLTGSAIPILVALVVASVWLTYGYAARQMLGIRKEASREEKE